jgi:hypothetical protein
MTSQNETVHGDTVEKAQQCSVPGCDQSSGLATGLGRMCLTHFIKACYQKLEQLNQNTDTWSAGGTEWESARRFIQECVQMATSFTVLKPEIVNLERAQLLDISFWAAELGQQLRRSARDPLTIPIQLISEIAGHIWEEETCTLDLSRHGARTTCQHTVKNDDVLKVRRFDTGEQLNARIVWQRQTTTGTHEIGIEFLNSWTK